MGIHRVCVPPETLRQSTITLSPSIAHYIRHVLRLRVGDEITAFDGTGQECLVRLTSMVDNKRATSTIDREDDPDHVLTSVELEQGMRPQRTVSIAATHDASELVHDELEIMGHDYLYEQALQEVSTLLM